MYTPSSEILERYAQVLINFALNSGRGIKKGEVVRISLPEAAKPLYVPLRNTALKAGAHPLMHYIADNIGRADEYNLSSDEQLTFFPKKMMRGIIDQCDHTVFIIAEADKYELKGIDPRKILLKSNSARKFLEWRNQKEAGGRFTWTLALYGTPAMAKEVGLSNEEYWREIIKACYLDYPDPIKQWRQTYTELERIRLALNRLAIDSLRVEADGIDLTVGLGPQRQWIGGSGRNIPSFELFISPDWRRTEGEIRFNQPLYRYGNVITNIYLRFRQGLVVEASADQGEELLREMIKTKNADKIGEFSLTDSRFSRITRPMGETLYDENIGGAQGNTHLALGGAYRDSYPKSPAGISEKQWRDWGYNKSVVHTDIISTTRRVVTAKLANGRQEVIYKDGHFTL